MAAPIMPGQGPPRPSPQNPLFPPMPGPGGAFSSPAAIAAFAHRYNIAMPPPPKLPPVQPGGVPAGQFLGAPGSVKAPTVGPYPGFMTTQDMMDQAKQMADAQFAPVLQEAQKQQAMLHAQNQAQLQAIQKAYSLMGIDPKSALGVANYNKAVAEAQSSESDFAGKIVDLISQKATAEQGYLGDIQKNQVALYGQNKPILHWSGNQLSAYDPVTGKVSVLSGGGGMAAVNLPLSRELHQYVDKNGIPIPSLAGKVPSESSSKPSNWQSTTLNGKPVLFNPNDATYHDPITKAVLTNLPNKAATTPEPDLSKSVAVGQWVDKNLKPIPSLQGIKVPPRFKPDGSGGGGSAPRSVVAAGNAKIRDSFWHPLGSYHKYTQAELNGILVRSNNARMSAWNDLSKAQRKKVIDGGGGPPRMLVLGDIASMSTAQRAHLGIAGSHMDPQATYMTLVEDGIPAREAWRMMRKYYPDFGSGYFPKAGSAAETAAGFGTRLVNFAKQQLGQTYVWGGESRKEGGFDCSGLVDWAMRQEGYTGDRVTTWTLRGMGQHVVRKNIQPGDLIITNNGKHVVIYAGNGQVVAGSSSQGKVVMQPLAGITINEIRRINIAQPPSTTPNPGTTPKPGTKQSSSVPPSVVWDPQHKFWYDTETFKVWMHGHPPDANGNPGGTVTRPVSTSKIQPDKINSFLSHHSSPLAGLGNVFVKAGTMYGVDPALLIAIAGAESSFGRVLNGSHNPFGWLGHNFSTFPAAVYAVAKHLRDAYIGKGLTTIEAIGHKWAPLKAANDPTNLNANWVGNVSQYYRELTGAPV